MKKKEKRLNLCIKTKHFITIRLKKPNENTTTLQVQMFFIDIYIFFFLNIDKKDTKWENTKYLSTCLQCVCCNKKKTTKGTCIFFLHSVFIDREKDIKGTIYEYTKLSDSTFTYTSHTSRIITSKACLSSDGLGSNF